jgi:hypothetical protein
MIQSILKMAEFRLTFEQCRLILKWYWKFENVCEVQRQWRHKFATEPPTQPTISRIHDESETDGSVQDVYKQQSERPHSSTSGENSAMVSQQITKSRKQSVR